VEVKVTIDPDSKDLSDPFELMLSLSGTAGTGERLRTDIPVRGRVKQEIYCVPDQIVLGTVPIGQQAESVIVLRSRKGEQVEVREAGGGGADITWQVMGKQGTGQKVRVVQRVRRRGEQTTLLRLRVMRQGGDRRGWEVRVPVSHYGVPASSQ
jgi:hypothetical protein